MLGNTFLFNPVLGLKHVAIHSHGAGHADSSFLSGLMNHVGSFGTWILHGIFFRIGIEIVSHLPFMLIVIIAIAIGGLCLWNHFHKRGA